MFCEKGVFNREQTEQILKAGVNGGLAINFHGDELTDLGSGEVSDFGSERHLLNFIYVCPSSLKTGYNVYSECLFCKHLSQNKWFHF